MIQSYLPCFPNLDYLPENIPLRIVNKTLCATPEDMRHHHLLVLENMYSLLQGSVNSSYTLGVTAMSAFSCSQNYHLAQQGFRLALVANTYQHYNTFRECIYVMPERGTQSQSRKLLSQILKTQSKLYSYSKFHLYWSEAKKILDSEIIKHILGSRRIALKMTKKTTTCRYSSGGEIL